MIKLTPKGRRFADVVKLYLQDEDHTITRAARQLETLKYRASRNRNVKFRLNDGIRAFGTIEYTENARLKEAAYWSSLCYLTDMTLWWNEDIRNQP